MNSDRLSARIDWGHCALIAIMAGITIFYLHDAWEASNRVRNLILVLPASILALAMCLIVLYDVLSAALRAPKLDATSDPESAPAPDSEAGGAASEPETLLQRFRPAVLMGTFGLYILSLPYLGFDVATALFMAVSLLIDGERRPLFVVGLSVGFAVLVTIAFRWLIPYPMPILLL
ncbi:tripartite tricarboxylate transporter TctB family protein [Fodinicurvata sp. EGI_FJ10296]|uniref:tripartite tricarboxylate transporter TctB family protein n=1 Tax=Fodinicurvata sp. EGI_FJ10296 TaxID=3231908 RepID=UPI0034534B27